MREKNGLDKSAFNNFYNDNNNDFEESKDRKRMRQKVIKFIQNAPKCENFCWKKGEVRSKIYWCKKIDKACIFVNCPKNNNKGINN